MEKKKAVSALYWFHLKDTDQLVITTNQRLTRAPQPPLPIQAKVSRAPPLAELLISHTRHARGWALIRNHLEARAKGFAFGFGRSC